MKKRTRHLLRKFQYPLITVLTFFPLVLAVHAFYAPELIGASWRLPACYGALAMIMMLLWRKLRLVFSLLAGTAMVYLCYRDHSGTLRWILVGEGAFFAGLLVWSLPFASWDENRDLPVGFLWFGVALYAFWLILEKIFTSQNNPLLTPIVPWLTYGMVAYLLLTMLSMNRRGLTQASTGRQGVPAAMRRKNTLMTVLVFIGGGILALLPQVVNWITGLAKALIRLLWQLLFSEADPNETIPVVTLPSGEKPGLDQMEDPGTTSLFLKELFRILGAVLLVLSASVLLFMILRKLFSALRKLLRSFGSHMRDSGEEYEDEITDTREQRENTRRTRRESRDRWRMGELGLSPGEKIRYRFRQLLRRHPEWSASITAREKLPEEVAGLYEQVRYGDRTVSDEDAKNFRKETKKL